LFQLSCGTNNLLQTKVIKHAQAYYPDQQMHITYMNNILYIVSTPTCSTHMHHLQGVLYSAKLQND